MTFPSNPTILDNFNRGNEGPPMTGWTDLQNGLKVVSSQCVADTGASTSKFNTAFDKDQEFFVTIVTKSPTDGGVEAILARLSTSFDGYRVLWFESASGTDEIIIQRSDGGILTQLGAIIFIDKSDGSKLGIRCVGSTIEAWYDTGGGWTLAGSRTDSNYAGNDKPALGLIQLDSVFDDFGGGDFVADVRKHIIQAYMRINA